jgi:DNA-binding NarL/FixJ family response regulator
VLEVDEHISVVGEAASGEEAVALSARLSPDVALIDAMLPGLDAVETTAQIVGESGLAVMLLTASDDDDQQIFAALRAGARALLPKSMQPTQLVHAIDALARGEALLSPGLTRRVLDELTARAEPVSPRPGLVDELTPREREVVGLVGLGLSNDEIAERLVVSPATAKTHVSRAMVKLHARDRARLVVFAYELGLAMPRSVAD